MPKRMDDEDFCIIQIHMLIMQETVSCSTLNSYNTYFNNV